MRYLTLILLAVVLMPVSPAQAESRKQLGLRIDALTQRILLLEDRMLTGDPAAVQLQQRLDGLEHQLRTQVGDNERLQFENARQREDISSLRRELDLLNKDVQTARADASAAKRLLGGYIAEGGSELEVESAENLVGGEAVVFAGEAAGEVDANIQFTEARNLLEAGYFDQAHGSLQRFTGDFPKHPLAGEALYWLGEIQMVRGNAPKAAEHYLQSLKQFRKGARAPDSMVKLAAAFAAMGDAKEACATLKLFPREYPKASSAVQTKADIERRRAGCAP